MRKVEFGSNSDYISNNAQKYLNERYNEDFEIKEVRFMWDNDYQLSFYPKNNNKIQCKLDFKKEDSEIKYIDDNYSEKLWNYESNKFFKAKFKDILPYRYIFDIEVSNDKYKSQKNITYKQLIKLEPRQTVHSINLKLFIDINENNKAEIINNLFNIIKILKSYKLNILEISIQIFDKKYFENKNVENENFIFLDEYYEYKKSSLHINRTQYINIEKPNDLSSYIKLNQE